MKTCKRHEFDPYPRPCDKPATFNKAILEGENPCEDCENWVEIGDYTDIHDLLKIIG